MVKNGPACRARDLSGHRVGSWSGISAVPLCRCASIRSRSQPQHRYSDRVETMDSCVPLDFSITATGAAYKSPAPHRGQRRCGSRCQEEPQSSQAILIRSPSRWPARFSCSPHAGHAITSPGWSLVVTGSRIDVRGVPSLVQPLATVAAEVRSLEPHQPPPQPSEATDPGRTPGFADAPVAAAPPVRTPRRRLWKTLKAVAGLVLVLAVVAAGLVAWGLRQFQQLETVDVAGVDPEPVDGAVNWLLVGTDSRDGITSADTNAGAFLGEEVTGNRTDTVMVARINREIGSVDLLSVPRDLWVEVPGAGPGRINGAFNTGPGEDGRARLVATVESALGIGIDHYAEVDFVGFRRMVDVLEGVPVWFEHPARDAGSGLDIVARGCHVLDGDQALALARARTYEEQVDGQWRTDPTGDLGRTVRQRLVLARLGAAVSARSTMDTLGIVDDVLDVAADSVVLEDGAGPGDLIGLIRTVAGAGGGGVVGHSLPVVDRRTSGGALVLELQPNEADAVLAVFRDGEPAGPVAALAEDPASLEDPVTEDAVVSEDIVTEIPALVEEDAEITLAHPEHGATLPGYGNFGFSGTDTAAGTRCG